MCIGLKQHESEQIMTSFTFLGELSLKDQLKTTNDNWDRKETEGAPKKQRTALGCKKNNHWEWWGN